MSVVEFANGDLEDRGYLTAPLLDEDAVGTLRRQFDEIGLRQDHGFFSSNAHSSRRSARHLDGVIKSIVEPAARAVLPGYRPFLGAFISKGALQGHPVELHQDWTYTDERRHRAVAVWIPLVPVDGDNGVLELVPGSHRDGHPDHIRPSGAGNPLGAVQADLARRAESVPLDAGTAVLYDPAVAHGSRPNVTTAVRPAVAVAFAPDDADLFHFHLDPWQRLRGFRVDEAYFTTQTFAGCPVGRPPVRPWAPISSVRPCRGSVDRPRRGIRK